MRRHTVKAKRQFIDMVLIMLEEGKSLREINLRQIAKRIGCAHTNAYNYFESYEQLIWYSLEEAQLRMLIGGGIKDPSHIDYDTLPNIFESYIDFVIAHPAWYRLIWMDRLIGPPPLEIRGSLVLPGDILNRWMRERHPDSNQTVKKTGILHSFLHGELSKYVTNRRLEEISSYKEQLLEDLRLLENLLFLKEAHITNLT